MSLVNILFILIAFYFATVESKGAGTLAKFQWNYMGKKVNSASWQRTFLELWLTFPRGLVNVLIKTFECNV